MSANIYSVREAHCIHIYNATNIGNYECCRYYYRLHKQPWYGLWWVILLQYTHLAHTAMTILHCPSLPDRAGDIAPVRRLHIVTVIKI